MATENVTWTVLPKAINIASGKTSLTVSLLVNPRSLGRTSSPRFRRFVDWPAKFVFRRTRGRSERTRGRPSHSGSPMAKS